MLDRLARTLPIQMDFSPVCIAFPLDTQCHFAAGLKRYRSGELFPEPALRCRHTRRIVATQLAVVQNQPAAQPDTGLAYGVDGQQVYIRRSLNSRGFFPSLPMASSQAWGNCS